MCMNGREAFVGSSVILNAVDPNHNEDIYSQLTRVIMRVITMGGMP